MLGGMRAASQNWIGRALMALVMGVIVVSFAIFGIGDIFSGFGTNVLAKVGGTDITVDSYRNAYQTELQRLQGQARRGITNEEARRLGLDRQVLGRMVSEAVLDAKARSLGLALSDADIAKAIRADDTFKGPTGQFDRTRFDALLRDNGFTERAYVTSQRGADIRRQISDAVIGDIAVPKLMLDAIHRYQAETRSVDYIVLPPAAAGDIPAPSEDVLRTYYDARKAQYRTPELRNLTVLALTPRALAKPDEVSEADAHARYDEIKAERYVQPETRTLDQLTFPSLEAAAAAKAELEGGTPFAAYLAAHNLTAAGVSLGTLSRDAVNDPAVRDAAFALSDGAVSAPIKTAFGAVLVHVAAIKPATTKTFDEVAPELKAEIATTRAKKAIAGLHDKIEDLRSAGKSLSDAAAAVGLSTRTLDGVDAAGRDRSGAPVEGLVDGPALLKAAFASDIGVDNDTLQTSDGGYEWFEVTRVDPARQQSFEEVKPTIEAGWREGETASRLAAKGAELVKSLNAGDSLANLAKINGDLAVKHAGDVTRGGSGDLPTGAIAQVFNVPPDGNGSVADGTGRLVFHVIDSVVPPLDDESPDFQKVTGEVKDALADDVLAQYLAAIRGEIGVSVNPQALQTALGSGSD